MARNENQRKKKEQDLVNLYDGYYDKIARYIYVHIGDRTEAEDLASEVFLKALKSLDTYQDLGPPMHSWLFKIARNLSVDHLRKMSKQRMVSIDKVEIPEKSDTEEVVESRIQMEKLISNLEHLSPTEREVINLRFFTGLSSTEAGKIMEKSPQAIRQISCRAIKSLRKKLNGEN